MFQELASIGGSGEDGPQALGSIRAAALLLDQERFLVADGQTQELHLFDLTGRHLGLVGGRGGGPGEHQAIRALQGTDDGGFCTWDAQQGRVTRFASDGSFVATGSADLRGFESIRPSFQGFFLDCRFVLRDEPSAIDLRHVPEGLRRDSVRFVLFEADGRRVRTLATVPGAEHWFKNRDQNWGRVQPIFGEDLFGFPQGDEFWFGTSDGARWTRLDLAGAAVGHRELVRPTRTASDLHVRQERERRAAEVRVPRVDLPVGPPGFRDLMEQTQQEGVRAAPARAQLPAYDVVVPGALGGFWLREYPLPSDSVSMWTFVGASGEEVGRAALRRGAMILSGSENLILVGSEDELGAPVLQVLGRVP